jgi:hypothetical protein
MLLGFKLLAKNTAYSKIVSGEHGTGSFSKYMQNLRNDLRWLL